MKNIVEYKGYIGSVEYSEDDEILFGKVLGIRSLLSYEGETPKELISDFHEVVDDYLAVCEAEKKTPERAYKGSFNVRINPDLHKRLVVSAMNHDMSLNKYVEQILEKAMY